MEVSLGREEGYYAVRSQVGDEVGGDVQIAPVQTDYGCGISIALSSSASCLSQTLLLDNQLFLSRASDSQIVGRAPSPMERCNAGQGRAGQSSFAPK